MRCKHHKKHYEEKRSAHLCNIQTLEANLESKEQELQVSWPNTVMNKVICVYSIQLSFVTFGFDFFSFFYY